MIRGFLRILRSPRNAIWLVLGTAAYSALGTIFPQGAIDSPKVMQWVAAHPAVAAVGRPLGMFSAFHSPVFLVLAAWLALSTASCAWSRTRVARRACTTPSVNERLREALRTRPAITAGPTDRSGADELMHLTATGLRRHRFQVHEASGVLVASKTRWGAWASPVFHWALVLLFVVIAAGQLTRAEGVLSIPIDGAVIDATGSYDGAVTEGPLYRGHSGLEVRAADLRLSTIVDGTERGESASIELYRDGKRLAQQRVYPNAPLRYGSLLIHPGPWGYAPLLAVETTSGERGSSAPALIDPSRSTRDGIGPGELTLQNQSAGPTVISVVIPIERRDDAGRPVLSRAVRLSVAKSDRSASTPILVAEGERVPLFDGLWLRFVKRGTYFSVRIADDWSVPWIYALFIGASLALVFAVFFPPRRVWLMVVEDGGGARIHAVTREQRGAPGFPDRVASILSEALPDDVEVRVVCN